MRFLIILAVVAALFSLMVQFYRIPDHSMEPTLNIYQFSLFKKYLLFPPNPARWDIVLYRARGSDLEKVGRVVALPSEKIMLVGGKLYLDNGEVKILEEPSLSLGKVFGATLEGTWIALGEFQYLIIEDHHPGRIDLRSRVVDKDQIKASLWYKFYYINNPLLSD